ncbi:Crp/Fnr family transcriptional regulator [Paraburkholderia guartelaensis]|nr:Crp/Fnr family transcriptional regulator [Paraburkholderia guartelaensis]
MNAQSLVGSDLLASMELFQGLSPVALADTMICARTHELRAETRIFYQGDGAARAYALIVGGVRISQSGSDGEQVVIRFVAPGEMFGTVALFTDRRYPAEAVTLTQSVALSWSEADMLELMTRYPRIAVNLVGILGRRLQEVQERFREIATQSVERRIAHALLRLAEKAGENTGQGTEIDFPLTRKHVAEMSGTTLYTVSRILTRWEKSGWIVTSNQRVTLCDFTRIIRIAEDGVD